MRIVKGKGGGDGNRELGRKAGFGSGKLQVHAF
jgi:hypothetical protein